jgi:hypothetical protein
MVHKHAVGGRSWGTEYLQEQDHVRYWKHPCCRCGLFQRRLADMLGRARERERSRTYSSTVFARQACRASLSTLRG